MPHHRPILIGLTVIALSAASLAAVCGQPDPVATQEARTPTVEIAVLTVEPQVTAVPTNIEATPVLRATPFPTSPPLPTASSDSETMILGASLWVDARPATGEVLAFINGQECGKGQASFADQGSPFTTFGIAIASDADKPGCGVPGAVITMTVNGRELNGPLVWMPGFQAMDALAAGPPFARYYGRIRADFGSLPRMRVVPYVGDAVCGEQLTSSRLALDESSYTVVVDSEDSRPGCGRPGAVVVFKLSIDGLPEIDLGTEAWKTTSLVNRNDAEVSLPVTPLPPTAAPQ